jgi:hypothetical protein
MQGKEVKIEEMRLRIPGMDEKEAQTIGQEVIQQVAASLPTIFQNKRLDELNLKVNIYHEASRTEKIKLIAEAIIKGLI